MTVRIRYLKHLDSLVFQAGLGVGLVFSGLGLEGSGLVNITSGSTGQQVHKLVHLDTTMTTTIMSVGVVQSHRRRPDVTDHQ